MVYTARSEDLLSVACRTNNSCAISKEHEKYIVHYNIRWVWEKEYSGGSGDDNDTYFPKYNTEQFPVSSHGVAQLTTFMNQFSNIYIEENMIEELKGLGMWFK